MSFLRAMIGNKKTGVQSTTNKAIVHKSEMPVYIGAANKIYNKEYTEAISDLLSLLEKTNHSDTQSLSMLHINLMQAYFKNRTEQESYFGLSTQHAIEALKYGHNTGLAPYRLIVNLEKQNKINQAIEVCKIVTDNEYRFSPYGYKQKKDFIDKLNKLEKKLKFAEDNPNERLFKEKDVKMIFKNSMK